jgi:hypothetical protein
MVGAPSSSTRYEASDAEPRLIAALAAGLAGFLVLTPFLLALLFPDAARLAPASADWSQLPAPRLQIDPQRELAELRRAEQQRLSTYGWNDPQRMFVHLPIDRALSLIAERGLPGWRKQ